MSWLAQAALMTFALAFAGSVLPLVLRRSDTIQHRLIAFASGVFLGVVFQHLLPEVARASQESGEHGGALWLCVLAGVVGLYLLENLAFHGAHGHGAPGHGAHGGEHDHEHVQDAHQHRTVGYASLFGLSVHSLTAGLGLAAGVELEHLRGPLVLSMLSHKSAEGFSLAAVFLLAGASRRRVLLLALAFSAVSPLGMLLGAAFVTDARATLLQAFTALAAGTFLFVALCDLLPEVFHRREDSAAKLALLTAGIGTVLLFHLGA